MEFPLAAVSVEIIRDDIDNLVNPCLSRPHLKVSEDDFFLDVFNIARYRVQNGNKVFIHPHENSDDSSVKLFLDGSALGAVLHQRGILPFHGSSFEMNGLGTIICGNSGAGKSSVAAAFCQNGAQIINDDISPVRIAAESTNILPIKTRIKLWDDALLKLKIDNNGLERIRPSLDKFYMPDQGKFSQEQRLDHIIVLSTHNKNEFVVNEFDGMTKFNILRKQIYRRVYLKGMPETEKKYFKQLFQLSANVHVTQVVRPQLCDIYEAMECIRKVIVR